MTDNEKLMLSDKDTRPDDDLIFGIMGERKMLWMEIMDYLEKGGKGFSGQWNWYNDGKQWLFKMTLKKKTIFWAALFSDTFKITFYFGDKAEELIMSSSLPDEIKHEFKAGKRYGKIRAISLKVYDMNDVEIVKKTIELKVKVK